MTLYLRIAASGARPMPQHVDLQRIADLFAVDEEEPSAAAPLQAWPRTRTAWQACKASVTESLALLRQEADARRRRTRADSAGRAVSA